MRKSNKKNTWFPTPRYLCRKAVVLNFLNQIKKGSVLEVGVGSGDLISDLAKKGYTGTGIEISDEAVEMAKKKLEGINSDIKIEKKDLFEISENFDIIIMLEVIEHIKDDMGALKRVHSLLNKGGYLIVSVPAHKKEWSAEIDEWAGHYRRYEKNELKLKLKNTGFEIIKLYNYGFPIANVTQLMRIYLIKNDSLSNSCKEINTERSGIDRNSQKKFAFLINSFTIAPFLFLQKFFFHKDWGDGYIVLAKKI